PARFARPGWLVVSLVLVLPVMLRAQTAGGRGKEQPANLRLATELMKGGKTAEALAAVRKEVQENPTSAAAANLLDVLGATTEARQVFQKRIEAAPDATAKAAAQRAMA